VLPPEEISHCAVL